MEHGGVDGIDEKLNLCNRLCAALSKWKVSLRLACTKVALAMCLERTPSHPLHKVRKKQALQIFSSYLPQDDKEFLNRPPT
mmetsp:Transcript_20637/g.37508  ORF Transcript_20637/g.37508 Transcript_20637/m.37508 type:complete len:81 (+) Transcript_20637:149-391(+)